MGELRTVKAAALALTMVVSAAVSGSAHETIDMRVSPMYSMAPAKLTIQLSVQPDSNNRAITVTVESADFFRSSEIPLAGDSAPRRSRIEYQNLPPGVYEISGVLTGSSGKALAVVHRTITVMGA